MGEIDSRYLSEAAVGVLIGRAAVGAVAAAGLLLLVEQRRGVGQGVLQRGTNQHGQRSVRRSDDNQALLCVRLCRSAGGSNWHCFLLCVYLCRDCTLEGFVRGGFIGDVALRSPVMFSHLREK